MASNLDKRDNVLLGTVYGKGYPPGQLYGQASWKLKTMYAGKGGHYGYPNFPPTGNVGGSFDIDSFELSRGTASVGKIWRGGPLDSHYVGNVMADMWGIFNPGNKALVTDAMGREAYNRMKPAQPSFQALNAIYELREVPSMLMQRFTKTGLHKFTGNYWLALKFGWEPLLRDVVTYVQKQMDAQDTLNQLLRDNGRPVRRSVPLFANSEVFSRESGSGYGVMLPILETGYYSRPSLYDRTVELVDVGWGSARFRYWLPDGPRDVNWTNAMKARILGLYPSPSVVWNALPWSWLIDWHLGVGDILENMETGVANRLAADYFYVMRKSGAKFTHNVTGFYRRQDGQEISAGASSTATWARKCRGAGDPFGWGTPSNMLNGMQLSILGALGMSRLR